MFAKRFFIILSIVIICVTTTGCSMNEITHSVKSWLPSSLSSTSTLEADIAKLPHPFIVVYGKNGTKQIFKPTDSFEKRNNITLIMLEPAFVILLNKETCNAGMHTKLENIFKREGFQLALTQDFRYDMSKNIMEMYFVKNGNTNNVFF